MSSVPLRQLSWPNAFSLIVLLVLGYMYCCPPSDLDFCWQVRSGERILDSGRIGQPDNFSYTIAGREIPDHEWLYEVILALLWRGLGDPGMKLARVFLFAAPPALLAWQLHARGVKRHGISLALFVSVLVLFYFERLRPLVCSTIGLQLVAGMLHDHCHLRRRLNWTLPLVMLIWGNLHPAVIMGQALILGAIGWEALAYRRDRTPERGQALHCLMLWGGLGFLASLIAPDPVGRFLYPFASELRHPAQRLFIEIRPPWHFLGKPPHVIDGVVLLALTFGAILALRWRQLRGWEWGLVAGVSGLALAASRGTGDWLMITSALAIPEVGPLLRHLSRRRPAPRLCRLLLRVDRSVKKILRGPLLRPQPFWPAAIFASLACFSVIPIAARVPNREARHWPTAALNWIEQGNLPTPAPWNIFTGSDEGTYLLWRLPGRARVYSDTRGFFYPGDLLMDSYHLPAADDDWSKRLESVLDHGTQFFLLRRETKFWKLIEPHAPAPLYSDDQFVILTAANVRQAAKQASAAAPAGGY
jgi:hypothetical protein